MYPPWDHEQYVHCLHVDIPRGNSCSCSVLVRTYWLAVILFPMDMFLRNTISGESLADFLRESSSHKRCQYCVDNFIALSVWRVSSNEFDWELFWNIVGKFYPGHMLFFMLFVKGSYYNLTEGGYSSCYLDFKVWFMCTITS